MAVCGLIEVAALSPAGRGVFEPMAKARFEQDAVKQAAYRRFVWDNYAQATRVPEDQIARRGQQLMSLDATSGDTMFLSGSNLSSPSAGRNAPSVIMRATAQACADQWGTGSGIIWATRCARLSPMTAKSAIPPVHGSVIRLTR